VTSMKVGYNVMNQGIGAVILNAFPVSLSLNRRDKGPSM